MSDQNNKRDVVPPTTKRTYMRPTLVEYGPISKLTRSGGRTRHEPTAPLMRFMVCL